MFHGRHRAGVCMFVILELTSVFLSGRIESQRVPFGTAALDYSDMLLVDIRGSPIRREVMDKEHYFFGLRHQSDEKPPHDLINFPKGATNDGRLPQHRTRVHIARDRRR